MTIAEIAKKLLLGDAEFIYAYNQYLENIHVAKKLKNHWKVDLTKIDNHNLHKILNKLGECYQFKQYIDHNKIELPFNSKKIEAEYQRIQQELNRRTKISLMKPSNKEKRQMVAKNNKSYKRGKNR